VHVGTAGLDRFIVLEHFPKFVAVHLVQRQTFRGQAKLASNLLTEVSDIFTPKPQRDRRLFSISEDQSQLNLLCCHWQWDRERRYRIKRDRHLITSRRGASDGRFVLACRVICNNRVVPQLVDSPCFRGNLFVRSTVVFWRLRQWLFPAAIQIFVQPIKQERDQLLRIMLLIARELRRKILQRSFEVSRCDCAVLATEQLFGQGSERFCHLTFASKRIIAIQIGVENSGVEVPAQRDCMTNAL